MNEAVYFGWAWLAVAVGLWALALILSWGWLQVVAAAGVLNAILFAVKPVSFNLQLAIFAAAVLSGLLLYLYWFYVPVPKNATQKQSKIAPRMVGMQVSLLQGVRIGKAKAQIKNAVWTVRCDKTLPAGALVRVTGCMGPELNVAPVNPGAVQGN